MPTTTRLLIKQSILEHFGQGDEVLARLPTPLGATAAGSTTTLVDAKLGRGTVSASHYDGRAIELTDQVASVTISSSSVANPTVITTATAHGLTTGDSVVISGHSGSTPAINGEHVATVTAPTTFTILINVSVGGTGGTVQQLAGRAAVDNAGFNGTSTLTFSPAVASVVAGAPYLLYPRSLSPELLDQEINKVLRNTEGPHLWAPSMLRDADFGENDLTNWPAVSTPTTREFVTSTSEDAPTILLGERALHLVGDNAEGAESLAVPVLRGETVILLVFVRAVTNPALLRLSSLDESSVVTLLNGVLSPDNLPHAFAEVRFTETMPSDAVSLKVQLLTSATAGEIYISPPVLVQSTTGRAYPAPSWFTREEQFLEAMYLPRSATLDTDVLYALQKQARAAPRPTFLRQDRGVSPLLVELAASPASGPVVLSVQRSFAELATNAATTPVDREYVVAKTIANILLHRNDAEYRIWNRTAADLARTHRYGRREITITSPPSVLV